LTRATFNGFQQEKGKQMRLLSILFITAILATTVQAQHHHDEELHFSHPLITESPSPDTKVRFDYFYRRHRADRTSEHSPRVEFEYAFRPTFSVEVNMPYRFRNVDTEPRIGHTDGMDVALKFANPVFKDQHVLLVYGVEFGLPTGSDSKGIGSSHIFEIAPFFGAGLKREKVEVVAFSSVHVPTHKRVGDEDATTLGYQLSLLFKPAPSIEPMIELDGQTGLGSLVRGNTVVNISPGVKFRPPHSEHWQVGAGIGFPVTGRKEFDMRVVVSAFYHF
jgi:hypothetical protein